MNRAPLRAMSAKRLAAFKEAGVFPGSTFMPRAREPKTPKLATRPAVSAEFSREVVDLILDRDMHSCVRCGMGVGAARGLDFSVQHRRARGAGGTALVDAALAANGIILCGSATSPHCHFAVEQRRSEDRVAGYWVRSLTDGKPTDLTTTPLLHAAYGWCLLANDGSVERISSVAA